MWLWRLIRLLRGINKPFDKLHPLVFLALVTLIITATWVTYKAL